MKRTSVILLAAAALLLAAGLGWIIVSAMRMNKWKNQELLSYKTSSSGDMAGSTHQVKLTPAENGKALLSYSDAESHNEEPKVTEYLVDGAALTEVKDLFLKHRMYDWDGKKFTNLFVSDGASDRYTFIFSDGDVSFSSQIYPEPYASKLAELDAVIEKYREAGQQLP